MYIHMFIISDKMLSFSERGGYANLIFLLKKMLKYRLEELPHTLFASKESKAQVGESGRIFGKILE